MSKHDRRSPPTRAAPVAQLELAAAPRNSLRTAIAVLAIVVAVFAAFAPALGATFVNWDDEEHIVNVQGFRGLDAQHLQWMFTTSHMGPYQPLSWLSLALDWKLWGLDPGLEPPQAASFHATNVALHALAAVAFFFAARKLFEIAARGTNAKTRELAAVLAALLFAVHPLRVESVAWVTERRDVLSGFWFAVAFAAWMHSEPQRRERIASKNAAWLSALCAAASVALFFASVELPHATPLEWSGLGAPGLIAALAAWIASIVFATRAIDFEARGRWLAFASIAFLLALMSKGLTLVLPALLLVLDVWPMRRLERTSRTVLLAEKLPLLALMPIAAALAFWGQASMRHTVVTWQTHTLVERCAQAVYGFVFYPLRTLWPANLLPIYELPSDVSFAEPRFWVSAVAFVAICALAFALRRRAPAILAAWTAFVVAIFPVIGFTQTGPQLVADRYSYLACMPFALLAAGAWLAVRDSRRAGASSAAVACVGLLGVLTFRQTGTWHDTATMFERVIALKPSSSTGYAQMATYRSYQASRATNADEQRRLLLDANGFYKRALDADANPFATLLLNYGTNLMLIGKPQEALEHLERYTNARPEEPRGLTNYGIALGMVGKHAESIAEFERAVAADPNYLFAWRQLAPARERTGDKTGAVAAYERIVQLDPTDSAARARIEALRSGH